MKRTARIVFVLIVIALVGNMPLFAEINDWDTTAPELWSEIPILHVAPFALRVGTETGPVDLPPWLPTPEADYKVLNLSSSIEVGNGAVGNVNALPRRWTLVPQRPRLSQAPGPVRS